MVLVEWHKITLIVTLDQTEKVQILKKSNILLKLLLEKLKMV